MKDILLLDVARDSNNPGLLTFFKMHSIKVFSDANHGVNASQPWHVEVSEDKLIPEAVLGRLF